jgi:hypothetical protein
MCAHFSRSWSRNAGRQPGASRLRGALTAAPSAELRRGAGLALRHSRQAGAADLHCAVGAVRAVRFDARDHVARGPTSPPTSPQPHLDLRNPCKSQGSDTPLSRSRKPVRPRATSANAGRPLELIFRRGRCRISHAAGQPGELRGSEDHRRVGCAHVAPTAGPRRLSRRLFPANEPKPSVGLEPTTPSLPWKCSTS